MANAPAPTECHSLQFKQLCKLKTRHDISKTIYRKTTFLITAASNYGLLIVGEKCGLKVIPVNQVFKDLSNHNPKNELDSYLHRNIVLPSPPSHVDVNCNHELLGVIFQRDETPVLRVYKTESFFHQNVIIFNEIRLTSICGTHVTDFSWNPNVPSVLTCCISDGSLSVLTFIADGNYEVKSLPPESNSTCFCWSPKGKQIVVGDGMGTLTQYVPELRCVKRCPPPATIFDKPCTIRGVKWLSNFQFIGVYTLQESHSQDGEKQTSIVVINTPKNGPVTYVNYEDVCFSSGTERPCQFYFIHVTAWNLLLVASANAVEVAVMSLNPSNSTWTLRILDDSARVTLPMCKSDETFPVGISIDYCSHGGNVVAMPTLSLLTSEGIVCLYLISYVEPSAVPVCTETNFQGSLQYFTHEAVSNEKHKEEKFVSRVQPESKNVNAVSQYHSSTPISYEPIVNAAHPVSYSREINAAVTDNPPLMFSNANMFTQSNLDKNDDTNITAATLVTNSMLETPNRTTESSAVPKSVGSKSVSDDITRKHVELRSGNDALKKFKKTASAFQNDVREVRYLIEYININGCGKKENEHLGKLKEKGNRLKTSISSFNNELDVIKTSIIETFACIQEVKTKQFKLRHPGYQTLSSLRDLEPTYLTSLKNVENKINYIRSQIEKATKQLDEIWLKYSEYNRVGKHFASPVSDNIYVTIVQQLKIFKLLALQTEKFHKQLTTLKLYSPCTLPTFNENDSSDSKIDSSLAHLAKNALNLTSDMDFRTDLKILAGKYAVEHAKRFHLCYSKQIKLQDFLSNNRVTYIQSNRLQRLKKKSLIVLSKNSFVNGVYEEGESRLPAQPKEELIVKSINLINDAEEYSSNDKQGNTDDACNPRVTLSMPVKMDAGAVSFVEIPNVSRLPPSIELKSNSLTSEGVTTVPFASKQNVIADTERTVNDLNGMAFASLVPTTTDSSATRFSLISNSLPMSRSLFSIEKVDVDKPKSIFSLPPVSTSTSPSIFGASSLTALNSAGVSESYSGSVFSVNAAQSVLAAKKNDALPFASAANSISFPSGVTFTSSFVSAPTNVLTTAPTSVFSGKLSSLAGDNLILNSSANTELFGSFSKAHPSNISVPLFATSTSTLSTVASESAAAQKPTVASAPVISNVAKPATVMSNSVDIVSKANTFINFGSALTANLNTKTASTTTVTKSDPLSSFSFSSNISDSVSISKMPVGVAPGNAESDKDGAVRGSGSKNDVSFSLMSPISSQSGSVDKPNNAMNLNPSAAADVNSLIPPSANSTTVSLSSATDAESGPGFFSAIGLSVSPSSSTSAPLIGTTSTTCTVSPFSPAATVSVVETTAIITTVTLKSTDTSTFGNVGSFFGELSIASPTTGSSTSFFSKPTTSVPAVTTSGQSNIFGQGTTTSLFSPALNVAGEENKSVFGSNVTKFGSGPQPSAFGGSSLFGSTSVFGNTNTSSAQLNTHSQSTRSSAFGSGNIGFNATSSSSAFQSVSSTFSTPTSFTGPTAQTENASSGFGSPLSFASVFNKTVPSFPAFGGAPTFGGSPAFGNSPTKVFGQPTPNLSTFGSSISQPPTSFENFTNENTVSFGNLAQQPGVFGSTQSFGNVNTSPSFGSSNFGGNSFSSWRQ